MKDRDCAEIHPNPKDTAYKCRLCFAALSARPSVSSSAELLGQVLDGQVLDGQVLGQVLDGQVLGQVLDGQVLGQVLDGKSRTSKVRGQIGKGIIAPSGALGREHPWEGTGSKKPWQYRVTAVVPHLDTPDLAAVLVRLLRCQTERPYILLIDTGSSQSGCEKVESLRADDVEVHYLKGHGYFHSSEPVCIALDLGFARCDTELIFLTHTDCFPKRQDSLAFVAEKVSAATPVVGWQMSERSWATTEWKGMVSHTFTVCHSETTRLIGATWHMQRGRDLFGYTRDYLPGGWPDTETAFGAVLRENGIEPLLLGDEVNHQRQTTTWWDHARSVTGTKLYTAASSSERQAMESRSNDAYREALERVMEWERQGAGQGASPAVRKGG